jgi:hypothetical protein
LLDKSVKVEPKYIAETPAKYESGKIIDLSKLDIEKIQEELKKAASEPLQSN